MASILLIGIAVVDAVARPVDTFPAPGGLRLFDELKMTTGGCAVNCAIALAKLGMGRNVEVVARVGTDPLGDFVIAELRGNGLSTSHVVRDPSRPTSFSFVAVPASGERSFLHTTGANAALSPRDASSALSGKSIAFIAGAMLMEALDGEPTGTLLKDAQRRGATTVLDTVFVEGAPQAEWRKRIGPALPHLDYFIPSEAEARAMSGTDDVNEAARGFRRDGARNVVIKLGARGVLCLDAAGRETLVPAFKVPRVVDTTGAGDCWAAGFLAGLAEGVPLTEAARIGNAVAAISVQAAGATTGIAGMDQVTSLLASG